MITNLIFCYYRELGTTGQLELIKLWADRWTKEGWTPAVMTSNFAEYDSRFERMKEKCASWPCVTGRGFEASNFERWLAFAQIPTKTAAVCDYDVFPMRPFPPRDFSPLPMCGDGAAGPGFIVGTAAHFSKIADTILGYELEPDDVWAGQPHLCDMRVMRKRAADLYRLECLVDLNGNPDFPHKLPLAHFGNASLDQMTDFGRRMSKAEAIRQLLDQHYRL